MTGERTFIKFQYGKEGTRGTAVAATGVMLADPAPVKADRKPRFPEEALGVRAASMRSIIDQYLVADSMKFSNGYFQVLPALFGCGIKGGITPTEVSGGQGDYRWDFYPSMTAANAPDSLTLERGDDTQAVECEFSMFDRYKISGVIPQGAEGAPVMIEAGYFARQDTPTTFTGALSLPTVESINAKVARLYLDTTWAGVGGTEKTGLLRGFDIELLTNVHPKFHGGADKFFDTYAEGMLAAMVTLTIEGNADADAIWDAFRAQSLAVMRLSISGAQIGTGTNHKLVIDVSGKWEDVTPISSIENGNNLHQAVLHGLYDPTGAKIYQVQVVTNKATY